MDNKRRSPRKWLYDTIFGTETRAGKTFDLVLLVLIIASVLVVILESVKFLALRYYPLFRGVEFFFTIVFTIEYLLRIYASPKPKKYIFSFFGIVDLLAILPTYISFIFAGAQYLLVIRALRLLRIFRILKLVSFLNNAALLAHALKASMHKLVIFISAVLALVLIIGSLMYVIEGETNGFNSIPKSIYWTIVTITTVGFGDITPKTPFGQLLASIVMLLGYALIAVPTGIVTVELSKSAGKGEKNKTCPTCKKENPAEHTFCSNCGNILG